MNKLRNTYTDYTAGVDSTPGGVRTWLTSSSWKKAAPVKASAFGCNWNNGNPSVRSVNSNNSVSNTNYYYVGSLATPLGNIKNRENLANMAKKNWTICRKRMADISNCGNTNLNELIGGTTSLPMREKFKDRTLIALAIKNAADGLRKKKQIVNVLKDVDRYVDRLYSEINTEEYKVGQYRDLNIVTGGKERTISILPFFDKCVQHLIKLVIEDSLMKTITRDAYSCLQGRGINSSNKTYNLINRVQTAINTDRHGTSYYLEMDIKKFYPSLRNDVVLGCLFRGITCEFTRKLLYKVVMAYHTMAIGDPLSQLFVNYVMSDLDHLLREKLQVKYYYRYSDNMWIFADDKSLLHYLRSWVESYLAGRYKLNINAKYQVSRTRDGIKCCGYRIYPGYILISNKIKKRYIRARHKPKSLSSYKGMLMHCNSINLIKTIEMGEKSEKIVRDFVGRRVDFISLVAQEIIIVDFKKHDSTKKKGDFFYKIQFIRTVEGKDVIEHTTTGADAIKDYLCDKTSADLPLRKTVRKDSRGIYFEGTVVSDEETLSMYKKQYNI